MAFVATPFRGICRGTFFFVTSPTRFDSRKIGIACELAVRDMRVTRLATHHPMSLVIELGI
jgi:hypothetical protein